MIENGAVTVAFRRWSKPTVRAGGTLRTAAGVLAIDALEEVTLSAITTADALSAGYQSLTELKTELALREGHLYQIRFHRIGGDFREALREADDISDEQISRINEALVALDRRDRTGSWTRRALQMIGEKDGCTAGELAAELDIEKMALKRRIRQLKELGLTQSLQTGYRLSARGRRYLAWAEQAS